MTHVITISSLGTHNLILIITTKLASESQRNFYLAWCCVQRWLHQTNCSSARRMVCQICSLCPYGAITVALIAAGLAALAFLPPIEPELQVGAPARTNFQTVNTKPLDEPKYTRTTVEFPCVDATCEAWLYMPKQQKPGSLPPVVLMAHGMVGSQHSQDKVDSSADALNLCSLLAPTAIKHACRTGCMLEAWTANHA